MLRYIITKILNKYKLYLCLMIGIVSIIMIFAMIMMFRDGSRAKLIQRGFTSYQEKNHVFPMTLSRVRNIEDDVLFELPDDARITDYLAEDMASYENSWDKYIDLPIVASQRIYVYKSAEVAFAYGGKRHVDLVSMEEGLGGAGEPFSSHYTVVEGADLYQDISEYTATGCKIPEDAIPCVISQYDADYMNLVVGEVIDIYQLVYGGDVPEEPIMRLYVNGIIAENQDDYFWHVPLKNLGHMMIIDKEDLEKIAKEYTKDIYYEQYMSFDYRYLKPARMDDFDNIIRQFVKKDVQLRQSVTPILKGVRKNSKSVEQMLYVIVLPLIVLVVIFISMIAFRIIDSEDAELTTLRNRGLSKGRLIGMYVLQSFILAGVSLPIGILAGYLFGKLVAGVTDFMGFEFGRGGISVKDYKMNLAMVASGAVGALLAVIIMLIPVLLYFIKKKTRRNKSSTPVWEKFFIDVALLAVSIYLLYNYNKQLGILSNGVLNGKGIDPVIFINATFFLFACGMLMLRLVFYIVKLIYRIGNKTFEPVTYAGLLQILRTRKSSGVISIFLVMTVAMSLFNANMARTINKNTEERIKYSCGADVRIQEKWDLVLFGPPGERRWKYNEPDYNVYTDLVSNGTFTSITKVLMSDRAMIKVGGKETPDVTMMGIHTQEFGNTAFLRADATDEHWFNYLNALAVETDGAIISQNLADLYDIKVGDYLYCDMFAPKAAEMPDPYAHTDFKVVAIVDSWPGYDKYRYVYEEVDGKQRIAEKENYLVVVNYEFAISQFGILPYEVWANTDDGVKVPSGMELTDLTGNKITDGEANIVKALLRQGYQRGRRVQWVRSWRDEIRDTKGSAIIQITNGLFTADFLVALLLCIIGYMIYWITSIRDRELLFGIYRATGITRGEINRMLGMEQAFLSLISIFAGILAGILASKFFVKLFAAVYLPEKHNIPVFTSTVGGDLIKLAVVLLVVVLVCIIWIRRIVRGLNITEALKLGED